MIAAISEYLVLRGQFGRSRLQLRSTPRKPPVRSRLRTRPLCAPSAPAPATRRF